MQSIKTGFPLERIQIDILERLPETNRGNKYVTVVVDMYTKWPEAYSLPNEEADTVAQAVMDNFVCWFGCPLGVLSDQRQNFESRLFRGLSDLIESVKQRTTPYHPQCDGGVERLIRTVTSVISKIAEEQEEWDQHLPKVLLALQASTHETTGFFPSMLMFGREMRLPIDAMRDAPPSEEPPDYPPFVKSSVKSLRGYKTKWRKIWRPACVTRKTCTMHAASGSQDHTKLVIWYGWRRRPFPGGCTGSSIVSGLDLGRSSRSYQMSPTEYRVKKLLACGRGVRRD